MKAIHNHSAFNNAMQRQGYAVRKTNVEAVFNYRIEMRVARKVKVMWNNNRVRFIQDYFDKFIPEQLTYKLEDLVGLYGKSTDDCEKLEQAIELNGYTALENYLVTNLKLKKK